MLFFPTLLSDRFTGLARFGLTAFALALGGNALAAGPGRNTDAAANAPRFTNLPDLAARLRFDRWAQTKPPQLPEPLAIAVFDASFEGYQQSLGRTLPPASRVTYHGPPAQAPQPGISPHGLAMAEIVHALVSRLQGPVADPVKSDLRGPKIQTHFHLFRVFGLSDLKAAVDEVIRLRIRLVLHSQIFEFGGNGDGGGVFNREVGRATDAGVIWVNAAGNTGYMTYRTQIYPSDANDPALALTLARKSEEPAPQTNEPLATLPSAGNALEVRCRGSELADVRGGDRQAEPCRLRAVLAWNSFGQNAADGTDKDLDLELWRTQGGRSELIERSAIRQSAGASGQEAAPPVEIIQGPMLEPTRPTAGSARYFLRVRIRTPELFGPEDEMTITVSGPAIELDNGQREETIMNPADHPRVITVGAEADLGSSVSDRSKKPELIGPSVLLGEGNAIDIPPGSSNSAAMVAAGYVVLLAYRPNATRDEVLAASYAGEGAPLSDLLMGATGPNGCFERATLPSSLPPNLIRFLEAGAQPVRTTQGTKIFMAEDPLRWLRRARAPEIACSNGGPGNEGDNELAADQMFVATSEGFACFGRTRESMRAIGRRMRAFEVLQMPQGAALCGPNIFRLPSPAAWLSDRN